MADRLTLPASLSGHTPKEVVALDWKTLHAVGEGLFGDGNEVAHTDLVIGHKDQIGTAFNVLLGSQSAGHSNLLAVVTPNCLTAVPCVMCTKVTIKGARQAVQMFGPAQAAVAAAVQWCTDNKLFGENPGDLRIICGIFVHWEASEDGHIARSQFNATLLALLRALGVLENGKPGAHPFAGTKDGVDFQTLLTCGDDEFAKLCPRPTASN